MTITIDGLLTDWTVADRLELPTTKVDGYEIYGRYEGDSFNVAIAAPANIDIGEHTTFWLNTDDNEATGVQIFGSGGAEYRLEVNSAGVAHLFAANDFGLTTPIATLDCAISVDGQALEVAIPRALIGGDAVTKIRMLADVNKTDANGGDGAYLPSFYSQPAYVVTDPASLPQPTNGLKIAIVYSETSASQYFGGGFEMTYSQLVMAAQNQAMAAGIPFELISEADLTNLAGLVDYDAIVFPSFRNVPDNHADIVDVLTQLVQNYDVPLITAGDFMTNDKDGNALSSPYAIMHSLLGIERTDGAGGVTANIVAAAGGHPITEGYGPGGEIRTYDNFFTSYFDGYDTTPTTVIAEQVINGVHHNAVISTQTGGNNVHFANEGLLADNNLLGKAIDWALEGEGGPSVSLHMSRNDSIVATRVDMDQSQEAGDAAGGIYDALLPILENWKTSYDFVASYYVNVGFYPPEQNTNWDAIDDFYQTLIALGGEIGSHSYTHPFDTNLLFDDGPLTQERYDAIKAGYLAQNPSVDGFTPYQASWLVDPSVSNALNALTLEQINTELATARAAADPTTLSDVQKALLEATYQFQFETAKQVIETQLGITIEGTAIPGMPDKLDTAQKIIEYASYLTGGGSLVGAGYPGAFGHLTPDSDKVYIAPNMSFDFTLAGFGGLTPAQALDKWLQEFGSITANSDMPIVVWPWHDYGPTEWQIDGPGVPSDYTLEMFQQFIEHAYQAGAEFVTLADLARRIATFEAASFKYTVAGDDVAIEATSPSNALGSFALDLDDLGGKKIASVANWYAYDEDSVFLDADGGTFNVTLGTEQVDVTRITSIGSRAQLVSLDGDGTNLSFVMNGEGKVKIDLKLLDGYFYAITGATIVEQTGDIMVLDLGGPGAHNVAIQQLNDAPTDILVTNLALAENTTARTRIADLAVVDPDADPQLLNNVVSISDARFEYDASDGGLYLKAGQSIDFEAEPVIAVTVSTQDGVLQFSKQIDLAVTDVNEVPTDIVVTNLITIAENTTAATKVADLQILDTDAPAAFRNNVVTVDDPRFEYNAGDGGLYLKAGQVVDFETASAIEVTITTTDGTLVYSETVTVTVTNVNEAPVITSNGGGDSANIEVVENTTVVSVVTSTDPESQARTYSISGGADANKFEIDAATGALSFKAAPDFDLPADAGNDNVYDVVVRATDSGGEFDDQSIAVSVTDVNEAPEITSGATGPSGTVNVAENTKKVTTLTSSDPEGQALSYTIVGGVDAARFQINETTGVLSFIDAPDFELPTDINQDNLYQVIVRATDPGGKFDQESIAVNVTNANEAPLDVSAAKALAVSEFAKTGSVISTLIASDPDVGDVLTLTLIDDAGGRFKLVGDKLQVASGILLDHEQAASHQIVVRATDENGEFVDRTMTVVVDNVDPEIIKGTAAADRIVGGGGADNISGLGGDDVIRGGKGSDTLNGGGGNDTLSGQGGNDVLKGVKGDDKLIGGGGNDVLVGGPGADMLNGGKGTDTASYANAAKAVVANLSDSSVNKGHAAGDTYKSIENIVGGKKADTLTGDAKGNTIEGGSGGDVISGGNGKDKLFGQGGNDKLNGGASQDTLEGGAGKDTLTGGNGKDVFVFRAVGDSSRKASKSDLITDFSNRQKDKIDLSQIDANKNSAAEDAFSFIKSASFSGTAGELRYEHKGGNTFVYGDVDGNGIQDFTIQLTGIVNLKEGSFEL